MKTVVERQLEVAMATLHEVRFNPIIAHALREIEAIGKECEVDAAICTMENILNIPLESYRLIMFSDEIKTIIAEVRRLRADD